MSNQTRRPHLSIVSAARRLPGRLSRLAKEIAIRAWSNVWLSSGLIVVVVGLGVGLSIVLPWQFVPAPPPFTVAMAMAELDAGNLERARAMADDLRLSELPTEERGTPSYILGVVLARQIEHEWRRKERSGLQALAAGYLEEARAAGYPPGRAAEADLLLGRLHFDVGRFDRSLSPLTTALEALPEQASAIHRMLSDAHLRRADPAWQQAQHHLEAVLEDAELEDEARGRTELDLARVYFELGDLAAADRILAQSTDTSDSYPEALMLRGRVFMREADDLAPGLLSATPIPPAALEKYAAANEIFELLLTKIARTNRLIRQARYLRALCQFRRGDQAKAEEELVALRHGSFNTHEGLAAGLAFAELLKVQGRDEEAAVTFSSVAQQAAELDPYENRWVPLAELRKRLELAYQQYLADQQFDRALVIADGLAPIVTPERSVELSAAAEREWALQIERDMSAARFEERMKLYPKARSTWMRAGHLFERLAKLRFSTRQFPDDVWDSAQCYFKGHAYRRTTSLLHLYMENTTRRKRPPALTLLGEAQLALGNPEEALKWLSECIQHFPKDPHSYRARIVAAEANREQGNLDAAKDLLIGNLENEALTPRSVEWRESKFALGRILYHKGIGHEARSRLKGVKDPDASQRKEGLAELLLAQKAFQAAIEQLDEAVQRDELAEPPRDPFAKETLEARYFIADAHRQSAKYARRKSPTVTIESERASLEKDMKRELNAAADAYFDLQRRLYDKQEQFELTPMEKQLLRNCYFARPDALFDLKKFEEARRAYSTATNRYPTQPESLEAYVQIANCQRNQNKPEDALGTLKLAKVVLERIPPDADFNKTTRYTREEWVVLLDWLTKL